ncbi:MAG: hypothetical protein JSS75_11160 [Bacteroidetes bacterium]|nr:hypothetical protein [Bacteroidota bacterium]
MLHTFRTYRTLLMLAALAVIAGCKSTTTDPVTYTQAIGLSVRNFPPSRPGETYALWFGFPGGVAHAKTQSPQHSGTTKYRFVSRFTVDSYGKVHDFDTTGAAARIGYPFALAEQADISVEIDTVINDTLPKAKLMVSDFTGTVHQGIASLTVNDDAALGYTFASFAGGYTLTPSHGAGNGTDLYLMNATSAANAQASIADLPPLEEPWQYALWAVDSGSGQTKNYYYGTFSAASGPDSDPTNDAFAFPGGRIPGDTTTAALDLRNGTTSVYVTLEPGTTGMAPKLPFGVRLLGGVIPISAGFFTPTALKNTVVLPTATVIVNR